MGAALYVAAVSDVAAAAAAAAAAAVAVAVAVAAAPGSLTNMRDSEIEKRTLN